MSANVNGMAGRGVGMVSGGFMVSPPPDAWRLPHGGGRHAEMFRGFLVVLCGSF
jgi:hypothetical protein